MNQKPYIGGNILLEFFNSVLTSGGQRTENIQQYEAAFRVGEKREVLKLKHTVTDSGFNSVIVRVTYTVCSDLALGQLEVALEPTKASFIAGSEVSLVGHKTAGSGVGVSCLQ